MVIHNRACIYPHLHSPRYVATFPQGLESFRFRGQTPMNHSLRFLRIRDRPTVSIFRRIYKAFFSTCDASTHLRERANSPNKTAVPLRSGVASKRAVIKRKMIDAAEEVTVFERRDTVVAICTAEAYDLVGLRRFLETTFPTVESIQDEVLHLQTVGHDNVEIFMFSDGCFVLWGAPGEVSQLILQFKETVKPFEISALGDCESETLFYRLNRNASSFHAGMEGETIALDAPESEPFQTVVKAKLAFSNGLADSVKLAVLENSLNEHIEKVKPIPLTLSNGGRLSVSRADVLKLTGELLKFRAQLNLHSELTDTPEIYWSEPQLEEIYHRVGRVLEIKQRARVLNRRLDYANELAAVLRSHLSEQHGLKLEWGIIILIAVEVAFETLHWIVDSLPI